MSVQRDGMRTRSSYPPQEGNLATMPLDATRSAISHLSHLLEIATLQINWWQWLAIPGVILVAVSIGGLVSRISRAVLKRLAARTAIQWDQVLVEKLPGPIWAFGTLAAASLALPALDLAREPKVLILRLLQLGFFFAVYWSLAQGLDVLNEAAIKHPWTQSHPAARSLLPVGRRILKVMVWVVAILSLLSYFGFPVGSLLAGLGIGGLAFALAGQKTAENLFGAVAIGLDQPLSVGDFVKIEDFVGTVETIGVRSTRIRTPDRTLITLPNGKLAEMRIETFAVRDRIRFFTTIGLVYETHREQMTQVLENFEAILRAHPLVWPDNIAVRFRQFGESSLDIDVMAWFVCDWDTFMLVRQEILLQFMEVVEQAGSSFAFPSRTLYLQGRAVASI